MEIQEDFVEYVTQIILNGQMNKQAYEQIILFRLMEKQFQFVSVVEIL